MLYPEVNTYSKTPDNSLTHDAKNILLSQIIGLFFLFFVVFCVIWAIPETDKDSTSIRKRILPEDYQPERPKKKETDFKEEEYSARARYADNMARNGYVLNIETEKWEKRSTS